MVKNGFINIYGVYTDDYIEGDALPCPKCGKSGTNSMNCLVNYLIFLKGLRLWQLIMILL